MGSSSGGSPRQAGFGVNSQTGTAIPETLGRYRLLQKIAKGGMAEVFAARSYGAHGFEKTVALKRILPKFGHDPQFVRMMVDEAKISVLLNHQNIAQILEFGEQEGDYFIVMEFVPGQSLSAVLKRLKDEGTRLPTLEGCFVVVELLQGLHAAHIQRDATGKPAHIIHRDVSPQNTLVSFDGHVKVIDFGIARARDRLEATEVGTIKGKLRYLAPEMIDPGRFHPEGDFDHRVDVFAAGIVLWELVSGRTLFTGDDEMKVYDDITDGVAPDLHKEGLCDAALMKIIGKALERDLSRRYATAEDFADDLRAYVYRTDPAFTHKRIAATLDRLFPDEKAALLALERGQTAVADAESSRPSPASAARAPAPTPSTTASRSGSASMRSKGAAPQPPVDAPTHDTRTMRSDKGNSVPPVRPDAPTAVVDRDAIDPDGALPRQREVTVMTIVSRESVLGSSIAALPPELTTGDSVFSGTEDATVTVASETVRIDRGADPRRGRSEGRGVSGPMAAAPSAPPAAPPAASAASAASAAVSGRAGVRVFGIAAAVGVVLAFGIVGADELMSRRAAQAPGIAPVLVPAPQPVRVERRTRPVDATVIVDGKPWTDTLEVVPGHAVIVDVSAAEHVAQRLTLTPTVGAPLVVDVTLAPTASSPTTPSTPTGASPVAVDAGPAVADGAQAQNEPPPPPASSTSSTSSEPKDATRAPAKDTGRAPHRTAPTGPARTTGTAAKGEGTLVLKASPFWGQVTIDGRVLDDQTPVSVKLPAGRHDVVVSHPPRGLVQRFKVSLAPGETVTRAITFE
jgi:serine/threonine-protein kinase